MQLNVSPKTIFASVLLSAHLFSGCVSKKGDSKSTALDSPPPAPKIIQDDGETKEKDLPAAILTLNGKEMGGWQITDFGGHGEVSATNNEISIKMGAELSGIHWANESVLPKTNYEIELDAMKVEGGDFFCGLTFAVSNSFCSLIVGGWGGGIVGISSINGADASENDSTRSLYFERNRWFHIRVRVQPDKIVAWIDEEKVIDLELAQRRISMRGGEIESSIPFGIATYQTSARIKNIKVKTL